jgi:hypothetical protein
MNEAPVAIKDAPVDRNVLLLIVLIDGMTPLSWFTVGVHLGAAKPEGGIKSSERWLGSRDELVCRHRVEGVLVGKQVIVA